MFHVCGQKEVIPCSVMDHPTRFRASADRKQASEITVTSYYFRVAGVAFRAADAAARPRRNQPLALCNLADLRRRNQKAAVEETPAQSIGLAGSTHQAIHAAGRGLLCSEQSPKQRAAKESVPVLGVYAFELSQHCFVN